MLTQGVGSLSGESSSPPDNLEAVSFWIRATLTAALICSACTTRESTAQQPTIVASTTTTSVAEIPEPDKLTASEVYRLITPGLGFVETPLATGSGILVSDQILVTNAHVVWPYQVVDVTFPDGTTNTGLSVIAVDWAADLALIDVGGLDTLPEPLQIVGDVSEPGSTVFLIGFPAEDPNSPAPAITTGLISRSRQWQDAGLTFIQSDALISGGQSGGALVDERGQVIGITSLEIGEGFALAAAGVDVISRIEGLLAGNDTDMVGDRWIEDLIDGNGDRAAHFLDEAVWVLWPDVGDEVIIEVKAQSPLSGSVIGPDGFLESTLAGSTLTFESSLSGPHFLALVPEAGFDSLIEVTANLDLERMSDPDHGQALEADVTYFGNTDYPGDLDWFTIGLSEGDEVVVRATSSNVDAALYMAPLDNLAGDDAQSDSDSGAGVIGADAEIRYTAPTQGTYIIAVFDETQFGPGTYAITVEPTGR